MYACSGIADAPWETAAVTRNYFTAICIHSSLVWCVHVMPSHQKSPLWCVGRGKSHQAVMRT